MAFDSCDNASACVLLISFISIGIFKIITAPSRPLSLGERGVPLCEILFAHKGTKARF